MRTLVNYGSHFQLGIHASKSSNPLLVNTLLKVNHFNLEQFEKNIIQGGGQGTNIGLSELELLPLKVGTCILVLCFLYLNVLSAQHRAQ